MKNGVAFLSGVALGAIGCIALTNKLPCKKRIVGGKTRLDGGNKLVEFIYDETSTDFPQEPFHMIVADNVTSIGDSFTDLLYLTYITVDNKNNNYSSIDGVLFNKDQTELILYPVRKTNISYKIPNSVTSIRFSAFHNCTSLTSIEIPDSVKTIESGAFSGCSGITSIIIPTGVTSIDFHVFYNCTSLRSITIPSASQLTSIGDGAFDGCTSLETITIPVSVTSIGRDAFSGCSSLITITVEKNNNNYSSIDSVLFTKDKTELIAYPIGKPDKSYNIPDSVTSIRSTAFSGCTSLETVEIPSASQLTSIGDYAFNGCTSLKTVEIPSAVTSIGDGAFNGCTSLKTVEIPSAVTSIGSYAFNGCTGITTITIPSASQLTSIGSNTFYGCSSLKTINIPTGVTVIGSGLFQECSSLTTITIPDSVTSIDDYAFPGSTSLIEINVDNKNKNYSSINGILFNKRKTVLILMHLKDVNI